MMPNKNDDRCITDNFIEKLGRSMVPELSFKAKNRAEFAQWKADILKKVKELLGPLPEPAPLSPVKLSTEDKSTYTREKWIVQTEKDCWMPLYFLFPKMGQKRYPAVLCCHGHGLYGKDSVAGAHYERPDLLQDIREKNYNYGEQMAEKGFIAVCPDFRSFGERVGYENVFAPRDICNIHFLQHMILGRTLLGANIFDGMRAIDFLLTREDVDRNNIGCMGLSFGGTMTTYLTLLDPRIKAGDIICYATNTMHYAINRPNFCGSQLVPGLYMYADICDVISAISPKPLLIESGASDTCFWLSSAVDAHKVVKSAYGIAGAAENLSIEVFPGGHSFSGRKAFDFFAEHLTH